MFGLVDMPSFTKGIAFSYEFSAKPDRYSQFGSLRLKPIQGLQVKGGGHTTNPGFSSTLGVLIAMSRFSHIAYYSEAQTVAIGAGLTWDDVYAALEPHGVIFVDGRISGVGTAGITLGEVRSKRVYDR